MLPESTIENEPLAEASEQLQKLKFAINNKDVIFKKNFMWLSAAKFNIITFPN